ncbi:hypothetical protein GOY07_04040 [Wolbachia endosymbiont of Litomosoides sigmodontis]|nr:hypothetical protein GOY07_04040 [Wolbachia endosymbiont of Litomosoides sigmodontis]
MNYVSLHNSKNLKVSKNIKIIYLSPYSSKLNSIERFLVIYKTEYFA